MLTTRAALDPKRTQARRRGRAKCSRMSDHPTVHAKETRMPDDKVAAFASTLTGFYHCCLVPLNFAPYSEVEADHVNGMRPCRVLEKAAGAGV